jgi:hypothetical protein
MQPCRKGLVIVASLLKSDPDPYRVPLCLGACNGRPKAMEPLLVQREVESCTDDLPPEVTYECRC